jgi:hypothetical protein
MRVDHGPTLVVSKRCGHDFFVPTHYITEPRNSERPLNCTICRPRKVWYDFEVNSKHFRTHSLTEKKFIEFLAHKKGVDVSRIEYEPKDCSVDYRDPIKKIIRKYKPDFRIGKSIVEIKDTSSIGWAPYIWRPNKEEVVKENLAKFKAAMKSFDDFRVYVLHKGSFMRINPIDF